MTYKSEKSKKSEVLLNDNIADCCGEMWGIPLFVRGRVGVLKMVEEWLNLKEKNKWIATVNPEFMMKASKDRDFRKILQDKTDLNVIDGVGLIWAYRGGGWEEGREILQGKHREMLASGSDLIDDFCKLAGEKGYKVFLLGGWENRAERTAEFFRTKYPSLNIKYSQGEPVVENEKVMKQINGFKPDFFAGGIWNEKAGRMD